LQVRRERSRSLGFANPTLAPERMSSIPTELRYAKSHEWLKLESDGTATIGISDFAQESLGDITYVQLPRVGAVIKAGETFGVVESVKAASDLYAPISGTVIAANPALEAKPETVNQAPYTEGWMLKVKVDDSLEINNLLDPAAYAGVVG